MVPPIYLHALLSKIRDCGLATASVIAWPFDPLGFSSLLLSDPSKL
jgi:hypothetical protein